MPKTKSSKNGDQKKPARRKGNERAEKPGRGIGSDPPIIVGGGGSTLIWIKNTVFVKELTNAEVA